MLFIFLCPPVLPTLPLCRSPPFLLIFSCSSFPAFLHPFLLLLLFTLNSSFHALLSSCHSLPLSLFPRSCFSLFSLALSLVPSSSLVPSQRPPVLSSAAHFTLSPELPFTRASPKTRRVHARASHHQLVCGQKSIHLRPPYSLTFNWGARSMCHCTGGLEGRREGWRYCGRGGRGRERREKIMEGREK